LRQQAERPCARRADQDLSAQRRDGRRERAFSPISTGAEWKQRVEALRAERERIAAATPDEAARRAAQKRALEASFTPEEQLRVRAILKIRDE
jgi:hypothetical protein